MQIPDFIYTDIDTTYKSLETREYREIGKKINPMNFIFEGKKRPGKKLAEYMQNFLRQRLNESL